MSATRTCDNPDCGEDAAVRVYLSLVRDYTDPGKRGTRTGGAADLCWNHFEELTKMAPRNKELSSGFFDPAFWVKRPRRKKAHAA